jgi:protein-S-isoprenylcysteine O-methyltransferase Ste14
MLFMELSVILRRRKGAEKKDRGSLRVMFVAIFLAFFIMNFLLRNGVGLLPNNYHWISYIGFAVVIAGLIFRWYSIGVLGKYFTGVVMIQEGHKIIKKGPYKILRHPSYTGGIIAFLGVAIATNDWITLLVFLLALWVSYGYRITIEERALIEQFGDEYRDYQKETWRIVPFVY